MAQTVETNMEYQMFKGLQRPLEFLGLQGRYITWAAITAGVGILGFMLVYALTGFLLALAFSAVSISTGIGLIMVRQRRGLYSKILLSGKT
ncbi:MAG: DUF4133 domain-containing protein [Prevotella sp.]|nr:DUF4133 domain-containing protein [Prevotella sp.]MDY5563167.1 DUF4133 domain-containing protein [Sodaliphilus sp.]